MSQPSHSGENRPLDPTNWQRIKSIGPAIIVASVVLGPGSILINSKVGQLMGYGAVWVLVVACCLMATMTAIGMRVGVAFEHTPCDELTRRGQRLLAISVGVCLFLIATSFQFSNNLGVLFAIEPFLSSDPADNNASWLAVTILVGLNAGVVTSLLVARNLYRRVEQAMKWMVGLMLLAFSANLIFARPSPLGIVQGLIPGGTFFELVAASRGNLFMVLGLVATTFSVGAAFYQAYLVKQRRWGASDLKTGSFDAVIGIATLGAMSLMIMVTAAAAFHGRSDIPELKNAADVARQLQPLFGAASTVLFSLGILAGALSSFLVNAMIGGSVLSDGLGLGSSIESKGPRIATIACLLIGLAVAIGAKGFGMNTANLITFGQSLTVIGNPLLALTLLWLATRPEVRAQRLVPAWLITLGALATLVVCLLSVRTLYSLVTAFLAAA